ncbi:MAG: SPOR domain-containing protein [Treponema sp.]|nr:SPOR domain-containing protein [Treponema sp.]
MKSIFKTSSVVITAFLLINASIWEGVAAIAPVNVLPDTGFYAATNSFPQNTIIRVTNLENEKTVEVTVRAGLDNPSFLILISKEAADAISLSSQYTGRVRIMQPSDAPLALSELTERRTSSGDPDYDPMSQLVTAPPSSTHSSDAPLVETYPEEVSARDDVVDVPEDYEPPSALTVSDMPVEETVTEESSTLTVSDTPVEETVTEESSAVAVSEKETPDKLNPLDNAELSLVPAEESPPQGKVVIPEGPEVAPIEKEEKVERVLTTPPQSPEDYFSAPVISLMEKGKFYVQIMSFSKPELVESAVSVIREAGNTDKVVIQVTELRGKPIYRILLGPVDRRESQMLLQEFKKNGYTDAFVWAGK